MLIDMREHACESDRGTGSGVLDVALWRREAEPPDEYERRWNTECFEIRPASP
jgi:hypothetical protein